MAQIQRATKIPAVEGEGYKISADVNRCNRGWSATGNWNNRARQATGLLINSRHSNTSIVIASLLPRDRIGCRTLGPNDSSRCPWEYRLYSCSSLVLHVWKHVRIGVQREGRAGMSELLRNNLGHTPADKAIVAAEWPVRFLWCPFLAKSLLTNRRKQLHIVVFVSIERRCSVCYASCLATTTSAAQGPQAPRQLHWRLARS